MKFLQAISAWLAKWTPLFVAAVAVGTYFVPDAFGWVRGDTQNAVLGVEKRLGGIKVLLGHEFL